MIIFSWISLYKWGPWECFVMCWQHWHQCYPGFCLVTRAANVVLCQMVTTPHWLIPTKYPNYWKMISSTNVIQMWCLHCIYCIKNYWYNGWNMQWQIWFDINWMSLYSFLRVKHKKIIFQKEKQLGNLIKSKHEKLRIIEYRYKLFWWLNHCHNAFWHIMWGQRTMTFMNVECYTCTSQCNYWFTQDPQI